MGKMTIHRCASVAALAGAIALGGCAASNFHFSEVVGAKYWRTNIDTYPVMINTVDGRDYIARSPILVDPGVRTVVVQGPPTVANVNETQSIQLLVKPCTRYYLVAVKPSRLESEFTVKVDYEEPVAGCTPPPSGG